MLMENNQGVVVDICLWNTGRFTRSFSTRLGSCVNVFNFTQILDSITTVTYTNFRLFLDTYGYDTLCY